MEILNLKCCGIKEIAGLSHHETTKGALKSFGELTYFAARNVKGPKEPPVMVPAPIERFRYVIFSQANTPGYLESLSRSKYGEKFAALILKERLGTLIETTPNINPNSNNMLRVWVWTIDHDRTKAYIEGLRKAKT